MIEINPLALAIMMAMHDDSAGAGARYTAQSWLTQTYDQQHLFIQTVRRVGLSLTILPAFTLTPPIRSSARCAP